MNFLLTHNNKRKCSKDIQRRFFYSPCQFCIVMMCNDETETTASEFQRQDYKQTMKGVKTRDETRPKKRERGR